MLPYYLHSTNAVSLCEAQEIVLDTACTSSKFYRDAAVMCALKHTGRGQAGCVVDTEIGPITKGHQAQRSEG